ncbi:hypothetical protein KY366_05250 [Candidatus Woesearchaeota archaeon]|nr:hypothetical protein [Candidatus Woesearchaeota archaeon]
MIYRDYLIKSPYPCKKLGILGEYHIYNPRETQFARKVVSQYHTIAVEGSDEFNDVKLILRLYRPFISAYFALTDRSYRNKSALGIARESGKEVVRLGDDAELSQMHKIALTMFGLMTIPLIPAAPLVGLCQETLNAFYRRVKLDFLDIRGSKRPLHYVISPKSRDMVMPSKSLELLADRASVLINCGDSHVSSITSHLNELAGMKLLSESYP